VFQSKEKASLRVIGKFQRTGDKDLRKATQEEQGE
jgi:hypothetical protein